MKKIICILFVSICFSCNDDRGLNSKHISKKLAEYAILNYNKNSKELNYLMPEIFYNDLFVKLDNDSLGLSNLDLIYKYYKVKGIKINFETYIDSLLFKNTELTDIAFKDYIKNKEKIDKEIMLNYKKFGIEYIYQNYTYISNKRRLIKKDIGESNYSTVSYLLIKNGYFLFQDDVIGHTYISSFEDISELN